MLKELLRIPVLVLIILTLLSGLGFWVVGQQMEAAMEGYFSMPEYVCFEFSWTAEKAGEIMNGWDTTGVRRAVKVTVLDFGYLVGYGLMGFGLVLLVTRGVVSPKLKKIGLVVSLFPLIASVCDAVENANLLVMLHRFPDPASSLNAFLASLFATIKFGLLGITLLFFLVQVVTLAAEKIKG